LNTLAAIIKVAGDRWAIQGVSVGRVGASQQRGHSSVVAMSDLNRELCLRLFCLSWLVLAQ
jgi:hypothetical protein